jgi:hypothetical protein
MKGLKAEPLGLCPCGGRIFASINPPAVMHAQPECDKFRELEPDDFLAYVRRTREERTA